MLLSVQNSGEGFTGIIQKLAAEYTKTNANVVFENQNATQADLEQKLQLLAASDSLPAIYNVDNPTQLSQLAEKGQAADIKDLFKKLGILDKLNPAAVNSFLAECINLCSTTNPMQENTSGQVGLK